MAIAAVAGVVIVAALGVLFLRADSLKTGAQEPGLLTWTAIVGVVYFGILMLWVALIRGGVAALDDPWLWVGLAGPVVVWAVVITVSVSRRRAGRSRS